VGCLSCHSIHHAKSTEKLLVGRSENLTCLSCHVEQRKAMTQRSTHLFRDELVRSTMQCSGCHNAHGSPTERMLRENSLNDTCLRCHTEKRGPFLWEHAPVRENCLTCHTPHGSNHAKLQRVAVPYLCQQCHANTRHPGTLYDARNTPEGTSPSNRLVERGCVNCHSAVHGSNHPSSPYLAH
jgi:DmsE family decaheme c-type cytochrome